MKNHAKKASLASLIIALFTAPTVFAQESMFEPLALKTIAKSSQNNVSRALNRKLSDASLNADRYILELTGKRIPVKRMQIASSPTTQLNQHQSSQTQRISTTHELDVFYFEEGKGSIVFEKVDGQIAKARFHDVETARTLLGVATQDGSLEFIEQDIDTFICDRYDHAPATPQPSQANPDIIAEAENITLAQLQSLESRPSSDKVIFIDYWGGTVSGTAWNANNNNQDINYEPYNTDGNSNTFSSNEREKMYVAWAEAADDYAPFNVNITTDINVFNATPINKRTRMIATSTNTAAPGSGGVAYVGIFGRNNEFYSVGWTFNSGFTTMGMTHSHEAGHQMGLGHDGDSNNNPNYYSGHGNWGAIMGAPFGKDYVQWSKGDYNGANRFENDIDIIKAELGEVADDYGNSNATAEVINIDGADLTGIISPAGLRDDTDVFLLQQSVTSTVDIDVRSFAEGLATGTGPNLSMLVQLKDVNGNTIAQQQPTNNASTNAFEFSQSLTPGQYYLTIKNKSPNTNPATGFNEYGNGGFYRLKVSGGIFNSGDDDSDNIQNHLDNCPSIPNPSQQNSDNDPQGDACDPDDDNDSILDGPDNCQFVKNTSQANFDGDSSGDACDSDIDNDGRINSLDSNDRNKNICADTDNDSCNDCSSGNFNPGNDGIDTDGNGICNVGDTDDDGDNIADISDNCPLSFNQNQANFDKEEDGDACDNDIDNDGALNGLDSDSFNPLACSDDDNDLCDDCSQGSYSVLNDGQDTDQDSICDISDTDDDNDTIDDEFDNCPLNPNLDQKDTNGDGLGDVCDPSEEMCLPVVAGKGMVLICL